MLNFSIKLRITGIFFNQSRARKKEQVHLANTARFQPSDVLLKIILHPTIISWNELRFTCHVAFCQTNEDYLLVETRQPGGRQKEH